MKFRGKKTGRLHATAFAVGAALLLAACNPTSTATTAIASAVIDILFEFATATIPLRKFGKLAGVLSVSGGKAALKIETEVGKAGIKVGGAYPIADLRAAVAEAYRQTHGRDLAPNFDIANVGSVIIVTRGAEQFLFFVDTKSFCVANIEEASIISVDHQNSIVRLEVTEEVTDVKLASNKEGCAEISIEIAERRRQNAIAELKNALILLDLQDGVVSFDAQTGNVEIEYRRGDEKVRSNFNPLLLKAKHGINSSDDLTTFRNAAQIKIDKCSESALESVGNDTNSLLTARANCISKEGYSENDQNYFRATRMLST